MKGRGGLIHLVSAATALLTGLPASRGQMAIPPEELTVPIAATAKRRRRLLGEGRDGQRGFTRWPFNGKNRQQRAALRGAFWEMAK